jgi:AbiV family abortive infection protein
MTRDDSNLEKWHISAGEIPSNLLKKRKMELLNYSKSHCCEYLSIETDDDMFDLSEAPEECLSSYLENPRSMIFPPVATLSDGIKKCLQNALRLCDSASTLLPCEEVLGHTSFLLLTAVEELGKACMIHAAAEEAESKGRKTAIIRGFRDHSKKLCLGADWLKRTAIHTQFPLAYQSGSLLSILDEGSPDLGLKPGSLGSLHREYGLYVNYFSHAKKWASFKDKYDPLATAFSKTSVQDVVDLLRAGCNAFLQKIEWRESVRP